ncbi:hypothetical protein AXG93_4034s1020 [Marchantia polymorpha subsp. ruderalis]|uniref:Integrase catalytic domain-containing protein n=1 Tax=Marchantia polymorpha subsp. ruderalis TaxID=1480154 RepID=A0A176WNK3_MARPO|nr:hypothetical protein AXG93_4034s1020 [Marchantia polymorpha subsp. ruderalis]
MESDNFTGKRARWALILQEYDFQVMHRPGVANLDADGLSRNPCTSQEDDIGARWHGEVDEEMVPDWHAFAFMCWLRGASSSEDHLTSYSSQRVDSQSLDLEVENDGVYQRDVHDDALLLEFLQTSMMPGTVQQLVSRCMICDRVKASFNAPTPELHPLPIMGLGYRWSLDSAGPLPLTQRYHRYVLVMVEHFSKWIELVSLPDKMSEGVAYAFLDRVLRHFGAPVEVLTDQRTEFQGEFQVLCDKTLIDHRTKSRDHPEAYGLAERVVQTVKEALRKYGL